MGFNNSTENHTFFSIPRDINKQIVILMGIIEGISIDNIINSDEIDELRYWCEVNSLLRTREPYKSIIEILENAISDYVITTEEYKDIMWSCAQAAEGGKSYDIITRALQELHGIFHGILADDKVTDDEIIGLQNWVYEHDFLSTTYPYDEIESIVISILSDGVITKEESDTLKAFISIFVDTKVSLHIHEENVLSLRQQYSIKGICSSDPDIIIEDKCFCFTGTSSKMKRDDIVKVIQNNGGEYIDSVSLKTNYLIYGNKGSACWAYSCYGRKIEEAMNLRRSGQKILIVHENDFWDAIAQ